jgi:hypothetical protein
VSTQNPVETTWGDLLTAALRDSGALGIGMIPLSEDLLDASARGMWLLQGWERKRWLIWHLKTYTVISTGQNLDSSGNPVPYTVGPTGAELTPPQISVGSVGFTTRPNRIESAFFRQLIAAPNGPVDYPLRLLPSLENYNEVRMKGLTNFSLICYYDASWPYGNLYVWPWPQAGIYAIGITVREQLPQAFSLAGNPLAVVLNLPFEYYRALVKNIAMEVRPKYGIPMTPGDILAAQARDSLDTIRRGNTQIPLLSIPPGLYPRPGQYNIFSDQTGPT